MASIGINCLTPQLINGPPALPLNPETIIPGREVLPQKNNKEGPILPTKPNKRPNNPKPREIYPTKIPGGVVPLSCFWILDEIGDTLDVMSSLEIPLCIHGETNGFVMDREAEFGAIYELLASNFPNLKIIMEHITTRDSVELLDIYDNLYATITLHHLLITLDDVAGGMLNPHLLGKPIAKRYEDREALREVALSGHQRLCLVQTLTRPQDAKEDTSALWGIY